jgi:2-oxoisovalerate dehydrogenase E2 component (dihydrolipoyl transacylase)
MSVYSFKLPDIGEGVTEAEIVEWNVAVGDIVRSDDIVATVLTDKASVEIPCTVEGKVLALGAEIGSTIAVGAELVRIEVEGQGNIDDTPPASQELPGETENTTLAIEEPPIKPQSKQEVKPDTQRMRDGSGPARPGRRADGKPLASPAVRRRAMEAGIDLGQVPGTGPANRIVHEDLDSFLTGGSASGQGARRLENRSIEEIPVIGLRRKIAQRMALANSHIPHITIVEAVDITELVQLREQLNKQYAGEREKLTFLPFIMLAMVNAIAGHPEINAHYDDEADIVRQYGGVHIGIATQTKQGLLVPVVRHVEALGLWDAAQALFSAVEAAREGTAHRDELGGSTISITSLGTLGALATTPIINYPEVAIIGVNRAEIRPKWDGAQFIPRTMMNLSCSFDHRIIDGWNAAQFVASLKRLLENPAMIFVE